MIRDLKTGMKTHMDSNSGDRNLSASLKAARLEYFIVIELMFFKSTVIIETLFGVDST